MPRVLRCCRSSRRRRVHDERGHANGRRRTRRRGGRGHDRVVDAERASLRTPCVQSRRRAAFGFRGPRRPSRSATSPASRRGTGHVGASVVPAFRFAVVPPVGRGDRRWRSVARVQRRIVGAVVFNRAARRLVPVTPRRRASRMTAASIRSCRLKRSVARSSVAARRAASVARKLLALRCWRW